LAFPLVEIIERRGPAELSRHIVPASAVADRLDRHIAARPAIANLPLDPPVIMGILNATPDSFSDGGAFLGPAAAIAHGAAMIAAGARIVDVGGESTRPGAVAVPVDEEIGRVIPVIAGLRAHAESAGAVISIDTRNAAAMAAALNAGAAIINDVSALTHDPRAMEIVARSGAPVVLMHMQGEPETMQRAPTYDDVALDVYDYLEGRFGKTVAQNLALLSQLSLFHGLGVPLLIGVSRKGFIGKLSAGEPPAARLPGSLAAALACVGQGAQILRVHDVGETAQALKVTLALGNA
jgi:dihydropteroate synthase